MNTPDNNRLITRAEIGPKTEASEGSIKYKNNHTDLHFGERNSSDEFEDISKVRDRVENIMKAHKLVVEEKEEQMRQDEEREKETAINDSPMREIEIECDPIFSNISQTKISISRKKKEDVPREKPCRIESMSLDTIRKHIDFAKYQNPSKFKLLTTPEPIEEKTLVQKTSWVPCNLQGQKFKDIHIQSDDFENLEIKFSMQKSSLTQELIEDSVE